MSIAIIELNDSGLCCGNGHGELIVSPGYALIADQGITTGQAALQRAYLEPRQSFNQFWRQLNLSPLPINSKLARHHADLAYAQLLQLHQDSGSPEKIVFAAPGSFDREQLAILLGLAKAAPFQAIGLVDAAVAATSQTAMTGPLLHLDIQLHQSVITRLNASGEVERSTVELLPELGIKTFYDLWAQYIADQFIRQYRFDPLHTAAGEQQLYDRLPMWLWRLNDATETGVELDSPQGRYRINISRAQLQACSERATLQLRNKLTELRRDGGTLLSSHRIELLPGLTEQLSPTAVLPASAVIDGCLHHLELISGHSEQLPFITRLPISAKTPEQRATSTDKQSSPSHTPRPSHLLYRHRAYAIGNQLAISQSERGLLFNTGTNGDITLVTESGKVHLYSGDAQLHCTGDRENLLTGDSIQWGDERLDLIEVA